MRERQINQKVVDLIGCYCCRCGEPLTEIESVEDGIGPCCAAAVGCVPTPRSPANRSRANHELNMLAEYPPDPWAATRVANICNLGYPRTAGLLASILAVVQIDSIDGHLLVRAPSASPRQRAALAAVPGHSRDLGRKADRYPASARRSLWAALRRFFAGRFGSGPRGSFLIG